MTKLSGVSRADVAEILWRYGEDELALRALASTTAEFKAILEGALNGSLEQDITSTVDRCIAVGTVEVLTGEARLPARKRGRPLLTVADFWTSAGLDRNAIPTAMDDYFEVYGRPENGGGRVIRAGDLH